MTGLMILAGILITAAIAAALITANKLDSIRRELARLEQFKTLTYERLAAVIEQKEAAEGSLSMFRKMRQSKTDQKDQYLIDLKKEEAEFDEDFEDRDISLSKPLPHEGNHRS